MPINPNDYYVITSRAGDHPERWSWEIRRKSQPLGIKMTADGFQSDSAAQFAGKKALGGFSVRPSKGRQTPTQVRPPPVGGHLTFIRWSFSRGLERSRTGFTEWPHENQTLTKFRG